MSTGPLPYYRVVRRPLPEWREGLSAAEFWSVVAGFGLVDTVTGQLPQQVTTVRAAWAPDELRLRFEADDARAWATLTERDAPLYNEEVVEVFLDPVGDLASYYEIEVNPLNAVLDLLIRRNRSGLVKNFRWQCAGLRTAVEVVPGHQWIAELSIPLASLTPDPVKPGDRWRANFTRIDRPEGVPRELSAWSPTGQPLFHVPARFGTLEFGPE